MGNHPGSIIHKLKRDISGTHEHSLSSSSIESTPQKKPTDFETFLLIWLDPNVDTSTDNVQTQKRLREILTCLITFDKVEPCERWLKKCCANEKIILIVSGAYGQEIIPKIHHLKRLITIYVYCLDVGRNKQWAKTFAKVRNVISSTDILLDELSHDQTNREGVEDSKALQIYEHKQQITHFDTRTVSFVSYQLLLEILISPNYILTQGTYYELLHILRQYSSDDQYGTQLINEFQRTYDPKRAILWLTRHTPLSRFVNKALREQDIQMLFALRFLLVDIHTQLVSHQGPSLNIFKLQPMLKNEMEHLRANPGQLMVVNGFLFASTDRSHAMSTARFDDQYETVLFDIKASFRTGVAPFAILQDIDSTIEHRKDQEVLFMCGSIFEVGTLIYDNSIWTLHLKLASDTDSITLYNMKTKLKETKNLSIIGDLLNEFNQQEKAAIYYERLFQELPTQNLFLSTINQPSPSRTSTTNVSFVLINLSPHMSKFALTILNTLSSTASNPISIIDDMATIDFSRWPTESVFIFTSAKFLSSIKTKSDGCKIFLFDESNDKNHSDQQRFSTIDELICQLADEIIQNYRRISDEYIKNNNLAKADEQIKQINRIYAELRQVNEKFSKSTSVLKKASDNIETQLICLTSKAKKDEEDMKCIQEDFKDYFSSYVTFSDFKSFDSFLADENKITDLFIIIYNNYEESTVNLVRQLSNVKYIYRYGESRNKDNNFISNQNDLRYRLASDLIDHYAKLGEQYRTNKQSKLARKMFEKARNLCVFLSENCF
ncbi:unnamed protein product [Rotaria socialis]|uniref:Uncharacterized protein n=1 Tax=Rotaria socialis TaxID=392032 RepID=A0A818LYJ5_9BILA|nr:unnamed protein product [Rotaria socialis]